jgi:alpha-glucosidase
MWREDPSAQLVGDRIARFRDPAHAEEPPVPSLALIREPRPSGLAGSEIAARPVFSETETHRLVRIVAPSGTSLYGTGEVAGSLLRNGRRTVCWNTDSFQYDLKTESLYQSHPWVLAVREDGSAFGVLADTTWRCEIDLGGDAAQPEINFRCDGPSPAVYIVERASPQEVVRALADLTGHMPMPPRWALGYHQCRWSYEPEGRVREIARGFRSRRMPCDVIWMDIDYMDGFKCFTFDPKKFPSPRVLNEDLRRLGFRSIYMIDPGIKAEEGYFVYEAGKDGDHFVKTAEGREFNGMVWPGACAFPDFTRQRTRRWWAELYREYMAHGIDGVWNDMNEPSVFDGPGKTMPIENIHRADAELGGPGPHARYHNVYGMLMVRASREGMERARPDQRPFILTRSNFLGGHRYAATWTGDNESTWEHLAWSIPMALNLGLSGQPFVGPDIGGFFGQSDPALFARWMGIGALLPFARAHTIKDSVDHEPWSFGPETEHICRQALERRYRLLPYLYTLFREASVTGLPVARPLFFADPADTALRNADDSFLLGADVLVRASHDQPGPGANGCKAPVPAGTWRRFEPIEEPDKSLPELRLRAGAIIPLGPVMEYTDQRPLDPLTLIVSLNEAGHAQGTLYEDAGDGYGYKTGDYLLTTYRAVRKDQSVEISIAKAEGNRPRPSRLLEVIVLLDDGGEASASGRDGETVPVPIQMHRRRKTDLMPPAAAPIPAIGSLASLATIQNATTRSISAENPTGAKSGGAQARPGDDAWCSPASSELGKGWKVRPCLKDLMPGQTVTIADIAGPGIVQHIWCTVLADVHRWIALRIYYDDQTEPSVVCPIGEFFANGIDGLALVNSQPIAVNPKGGMNSYWPMPFRKRMRIDITNDGPTKINEFFYQVTYSQQEVPEGTGYLHASWRRSMTTREHPEHTILDTASHGGRARGHYVGTYLVWNQLSNTWWGEGEVKFFIDGDPADSPTICGTGTEDYFGGAWGFVMDHFGAPPLNPAGDHRPTTYSTLYLGYPQAVYGGAPGPGIATPWADPTRRRGPMIPSHGLYRWHIPDPIRFQKDLKVTVQALGWWPTGKYQPLTDDIASVAFWYQALPTGGIRALPGLGERLAR